MYHGIRGRKFGRRSAHRRDLLRNLAKSLIVHEAIKTTLPKAKDLRPFVEKLVTLGKGGTLQNRRRLISILGGEGPAVTKLIDSIGPKYTERHGGYLRIMKVGFRPGDCAPMSVIQFV